MRVLASVCCLAVWFATAQHPGQMTALVTVFSETGAPIRNLQAGDFIVREGGADREVIESALSDDPLSVALLVDTVKPPMGTQAPVRDLRAALATFVAAMRRHEPSAAMSLIEFGGAAVPLVPFDAPASQLDEAVARLYPNLPSHAVLLEALVDAARALRARPMPRRAIVSVDLHSVEGGNDRAMDQALTEVSQAGATYWAVSVRGLARSAHRRDAVLDALTKSSGGLRIVAADAAGLETLLAQMAATLASQYTVTFARPSNRPLGAVRIESRPGHRVFVSPMMR